MLAQIRDYAPDVLMVGMGMPRQEIWIEENLKDIFATAIFCCGGLMDLVAGEIPTPPRWLGPLGLEWLFRLFSQPVRTWRRYLLEPWFIFFRVTKHYLRYGHLSIRWGHEHLRRDRATCAVRSRSKNASSRRKFSVSLEYNSNRRHEFAEPYIGQRFEGRSAIQRRNTSKAGGSKN